MLPTWDFADISLHLAASFRKATKARLVCDRVAYARQRPSEGHSSQGALSRQSRRGHHAANRGRVPLPAARRSDSESQEGFSWIRYYRTSSIMASSPAISTVSPGPCVRTARASGETQDTEPREGSASSSPTILKLCSRPSFLRRVTVVPNGAWPRAGSGLTTSALARRTRQ